MHYHPFCLNDHPKLHSALRQNQMNFVVQRAVKNIRYFDNSIRFLRSFSLNQEEICVDLNEETMDLSSMDSQVLQAFHYCVYTLDQADRIDVPLSQEIKKTQYDVSSTFRYFNQLYGGRRYVALCRDLIDANMDGAIQPYMLEDLVLSIFNSFNKSSNRDVLGLLEALADFMEEYGFEDHSLLQIYSFFGFKLSEENYRIFINRCLSSDALAPMMRRLIVDALIPSRFNGRYASPHVEASVLVTFPDEDICDVLENIPGGMKNYVKEIFKTLGTDCKPVFVEHYLKNPSRDMSLVLDAPFYPYMPAEIKTLVSRGRLFSSKARKIEIIEYYKRLGNDPVAKQEVIQACDGMGFQGLALALQGKPFNLTGFSAEDLLAVLPFIDIHDPETSMRITAYLRQMVDYSTRSPFVVDLFLALDGKEYEEAVRYAIKRNYIQEKGIRLCLADRFGFASELGYKEWRYHA